MIDISSETWATVKKHCQEIIERQTEALIRGGRPAGEYDSARGEIAVARAILSLAEPKLVQAQDYSQRKDRSGI
jgi:hypothetical protein